MQDIRELFNEDSEQKLLPQNHRVEFLTKLNKQAKRKYIVKRWLPIAASVLLLLAFCIGFYKANLNTQEVSPIFVEVKAIETQYLKEINTEWQKFVTIAEDEVLVERFRKKLDDLDKDYKILAEQFERGSENIMILEALIDNLQTRLQILKDIQEHLILLNQNNEHENTI